MTGEDGRAGEEARAGAEARGSGSPRSLPGPRPYAVLGRPVAHSLSPALHAAAFRALGENACYLALPVEAGELEPVMRALARAGGGGNVTVPHKERAAEALDRPSPAVRATGACNCFWEDGSGRLAGDNTDVEGFLVAADGLLTEAGAGEGKPGSSLRGARVLLLGAGGAARSVLHACLSAGVERVEVRNRTRRRALRMVREVAAGDDRVVVAAGDTASEGSYRLVVHATSLGLEPEDPLPIAPDRLPTEAVLDLVYAPGGTPFVREARRLGLRAEDGLRTLVAQAVVSLRRWTGREPDVAAMWEAARDELATRGEPETRTRRTGSKGR